MKNNIVLLLLGAMSFGCARSYACDGSPGSVQRIVCLADSLKSTLSAAQITTLQLPYSYDNARNWSNLPVGNQPRLGIKFGTLSAAQLAIVKAIVQEISGNTANEGYAEALQVFYADAYLGANGGGGGYGEGLYYLCFNGTPSLTGLFPSKSAATTFKLKTPTTTASWWVAPRTSKPWNRCPLPGTGPRTTLLPKKKVHWRPCSAP